MKSKQVLWLKEHEKKTGNEYKNSFPNFYNNYIDYILKEIPLDKKTICDVGCGSGIVGSYIKKNKPYAKITFLDANPKQLESINEEEGDIVIADFLTYKSEYKFDCIVSRYFHHYFEKKDQSEIVKNIYEHLNKDGLYVGATPLASSKIIQDAINGFFYLLEKSINNDFAIKRYIALEKEMESYFKNNNFKFYISKIHTDYKTNFLISDFQNKFLLNNKSTKRLENYLLDLDEDVKMSLGVETKNDSVTLKFQNYIIIGGK